MVAHPVTFMGQQFKTKTALKAYLKGFVDKMPFDQPLQGFDLELAFGVLDIHHGGQEKIGVGVSWIELRESPWGNRELWLVRTDGEPIDFTWFKCMDGESPVRHYEHEALREAIRPQISAFRRRAFSSRNVVCAITGASLVNDPSTHIDHHRPLFRDLADEFIDEEGGQGSIHFGEPTDTSSAASMTDSDQSLRWQKFHADRAVLRAVTKQANLRRSKVLAAV